MSVPFNRSISHVSHVSFEEIEEDEEDEESKISDDDHRPGLRKRASSVFSIEDYLVTRKEQADTLELRGDSVITHIDRPTKSTEREAALGFFEQKGERYNQSIENAQRRGSKFIQTAEQRRESRFSYANINNFTDRRESKYNRNNSLCLPEIQITRKANVLSVPFVVKKTNPHPLEPENAFDVIKVNKIIQEELAKIKNLPSIKQNIICKELSNDIKRRVKMLNFNRYKYIVMVTMGENKNQGLNMSSRFFWDDKNDSYASQSLKVNDCFVVAVVYAMYHL